MRADLEEYLSIPPEERAKKPKLSQAEIDAKAADVVKAYQDVIDRYPHTEIAAYCAMRLSGFYCFQGKHDKAVEIMSRLAEEFAGTPEEARAVFETGMIHAQSRHDPAEAIKWLSRVPKPDKHAGAPLGEDGILYLSAQEQLAKCELKLRRDGEAKSRIEKFKQTYPQYAKEVEGFYESEVRSRSDARPVSQQNHASVSVRDLRRAYTLPILAVALVVLIAVFVFRQVSKTKGRVS